MATKKKKLAPKTKAKTPVKSVLSSKKSDTLVIDLETLMVPLSILVAGLMVSISILVAFRNTDINKAATVGTVDNVVQGVDDAPAGYDAAVMDGATSINIDDDPYLGDKGSAKVAIVEFSDYECPFCKRHAQEVAPLIQENYVDNGEVLWVFRDFPIASLHGELAFQQAQAAECVQELEGDTKFFEYHDAIFETTLSNVGMEASALYTLAASAGVDESDFASCYESKRYEDEVLADLADGEAAGIQSTPSFIIGTLNDNGDVDGVMVIGAQPYESFALALDYQLSR